MDCLAMMDSGNYVFRLCSLLEKKGLIFEIIAIPCKIAHEGCGYCLKFPEEYFDDIRQEANTNSIKINEVYKMEKLVSKVRYTRII